MQIYNLKVRNSQLQIPASCTLEQLHYTIQYLFQLDYNQPYHFIDDNKEIHSNQTPSRKINEVSNNFSYSYGSDLFDITVISATISSNLYPRSDDEKLSRNLRQNFLLPTSLSKSDARAVENSFKRSIDNFYGTYAIKHGDNYFYYNKEDGSYEICIFKNIEDFALALNSQGDSVFKTCLNLLYDVEDDYIDISEFNLGEVLEIDSIEAMSLMADTINEMAKYQSHLNLETIAGHQINYFYEDVIVDNFNYIPGKLQVAIAIESDKDNQVVLNLIYENIIDKKELTYNSFSDLVHQIRKLTLEKINTIGSVPVIEVNDDNVKNILLPLMRYNIDIKNTGFDLTDLTTNPFSQGGFDSDKAQELMSKLIHKYGYDGLTKKIMSSGNLSMMDMMNLANNFRSNNFDVNDEKLKQLITNLYEAFKDDL